jgi:flagellar biosynthetic protein FlhB
MAQETEQNRSEEATPFKLRRAREKGQVARSVELGFLGALIALTAFLVIAGESFAGKMAQMMRTALTIGIDRAAEPEGARALVGELYWSVLQPILLLGGTVVAAIVLLELVQLRGFLFSTQALKPDFSRINPAKGFKRLFSARMLKETLKTLVKAAAYGTVTWLVLRYSVDHYAITVSDGERVAEAMRSAGLRLLYVFIAVAIFFALIDQILVRREFLKQMRMSRSEVTREHKEREGEPRIRQRRKQLHAEFAKQAQGTGKLAGSDLLIVNPHHYAVALRYDTETMTAPVLTVKGRNRIALRLKEQAYRLEIPVVSRPELARALFRACEPNRPIPGDRFQEVADLYIALYRDRQPRVPE